MVGEIKGTPSYFDHLLLPLIGGACPLVKGEGREGGFATILSQLRCSLIILGCFLSTNMPQLTLLNNHYHQFMVIGDEQKNVIEL
jgi:hypothetical protein